MALAFDRRHSGGTAVWHLLRRADGLPEQLLQAACLEQRQPCRAAAAAAAHSGGDPGWLRYRRYRSRDGDRAGDCHGDGRLARAWPPARGGRAATAVRQWPLAAARLRTLLRRLVPDD